MSHTATAMSDSSSSSSQDTFVDILNPAFMNTINLNDPNIRNVWLNHVWEYFLSGGAYNGNSANSTTAGSQGNSPAPMYNSLYDQSNDENSMQGIQPSNGDLDMIGEFPSFSSRSLNPGLRRQSEDLGRITSISTGRNSNDIPAQWITSEFHHVPMDISVGGMGNMDGIMAGDGIPSRNFEKWMVQ